jgi:thiol:disulfide interchange protein DsbD
MPLRPPDFLSRLFKTILLSGSVAISCAIHATPVVTDHIEAELVAEKSSITPGTPFTVALRLRHAEHWHTYWRNPGDSGLPTRIKWKLPAGFQAGAIQWPYPQQLPLGPLMNFGYADEIFLLTDITPPANIKPGEKIALAAHAEWLVCKDICVPESGEFSLTLPVAATPGETSRWIADFAHTRTMLPANAGGWTFTVAARGKGAQIDIAAPAGSRAAPQNVFFFPYQGDIMENAAPQKFARRGNGYTLALDLADSARFDAKTFSGILVSSTGWGDVRGHALQLGSDPAQVKIAQAPVRMRGLSVLENAQPAAVPENTNPAPASPPPPPANDLSLWLALVFAFIGGLLLNLMPCVFPVLGIKVMSFVGHAHHNARLMKTQGLAFLAGVLVSFWALAGALLALRAGGSALGWGFQLQSPGFIAALAILFLLMSLNLLGVFEVGGRVQGAAGNINVRNMHAQAFFSGVLATAVASPCTAPFMGSALGFTLAQPAYIALGVFTALALGMAAPIVFLAFYPQGRKWLPKPGPWMVSFKQFMAFPLLATVVWLAWVLGAQRGNDAVMQLFAGLLVIALAAWVYGRWGAAPKRAGYTLAALLLFAGIFLAWPDGSASPPEAVQTVAKPGELAWQPWSKSKVEELRARGSPVFVDFTAAWCITCQVNKRIALHNSEVVKRFADLGVAPLKADWTNHDAAITSALAEFGRNAVPLYVLYSPRSATAPVVLPELLTPATVLAALDKINAPDIPGAN